MVYLLRYASKTGAYVRHYYGESLSRSSISRTFFLRDTEDKLRLAVFYHNIAQTRQSSRGSNIVFPKPLAVVMAQKGKKKKAASNSRRGFATTSIPSKAKSPEQIEELAQPANPADISLEEFDHVQSTKPQEADRELCELEPEELEKQLEESDLQLLAEKHGEKARKDASHQASRSITEKRLMRPQAEALMVQSWLPEDLMRLIHSQIEIQLRETKPATQVSEEIARAKTVPEDDLVIRLWTVEQTLIQMGFSADQARNAICNLVDREFSGYPVTPVGKESLWGLNECLSWLALTFDAPQLPSYNDNHKETSPKKHQISVEAATPEHFGMKSYHYPHLDQDLICLVLDAPESTSPKSRPLSPPATEEKAIEDFAPIVSDRVSEESSGDDSGTDDDPEALTAKYLALKKRLYDLRPDLEQTRRQSLAKSPKRTGSKAYGNDTDTRVSKLQRKMTEIEADILFDREGAETQWTETYKSLVKEASERRRLQLSEDALRASKALSSSPETTPVEDNGKADAEDLGVDMLADLFSSTDVGIVDKASNLEEQTTIIRDFGKFNGLKPRRILEEACKAR